MNTANSHSAAARRGLLIILSSPSGAGKSTVSRLLRDWAPEIRFSVSATTRAPRLGEKDGREYHFRSTEAFTDMVTRGEMLEHANVFGNMYGSPKAPVLEALAQGEDILFDIDWQGGQQVRTSMQTDDVVSIFLLPPSIEELERRLRGRGQDSDEVIAGRMTRSQAEISHWAEYDYVLVNQDIDKVAKEVKAIVTAERLRRIRQTGLTEFVRSLDAEFEARQ